MTFKLWQEVTYLPDNVKCEVTWVKDVKKWASQLYMLKRIEDGEEYVDVFDWEIEPTSTKWEVLLKVKWKAIKKWTPTPPTDTEENKDMSEEPFDLGKELDSIEDIEDVLNKAMEIMKNKQEQQEGWTPSPQQSPQWGWEPEDPRKIYVFSISWWGLTQPIVAENVVEAMNFVETYVDKTWVTHTRSSLRAVHSEQYKDGPSKYQPQYIH